MKGIIVIAALAGLSACSKPAPAPTPDVAAETAPAAVAGPLAADGKASTGMYKVTETDGSVIMNEVRADGTYSNSKDGKVVETGKWEQKSPALYCSTKDIDGAKQECSDEVIDAKGVWTSVNQVTKESSIVERVAG